MIGNQNIRLVFHGPIPHCTALYCVAALFELDGTVASATGVGASLADAEGRCKSELAEYQALQGTQHPKFFGIASSLSRPEAQQRARNELLERHAVRQWWRRGLPASRPSDEACYGLHTAQFSWPRTVERQTTLLDITCFQGPAVLVAWSSDGNGRDLQFGMAVGNDPIATAQSAYRELIQMEFGAQIISHRATANLTLSRPERIGRARANRLIRRSCQPIKISKTPEHREFPRPPEIVPIDLDSGDVRRHVGFAHFNKEIGDLDSPIVSGYNPPAWDVF